MYYFISDKNFDKQTLHPTIPFSKMNKEDGITKRICVSKSINGCLSAIQPMLNGIYYVHWCDSNCVIQPTLDQVPDTPFTGEEWIIEPTIMNLFMTIKIKSQHHSWFNNMAVNVNTFELA